MFSLFEPPTPLFEPPTPWSPWLWWRRARCPCRPLLPVLPLGRITWQICHVGTCSYTSVNVPTSARIGEPPTLTQERARLHTWLLPISLQARRCTFSKAEYIQRWLCETFAYLPCVCACVWVWSVCGMAAPGRGPIPCHSETTSQSFLRSKISCPPTPVCPLPSHMCCSHQHFSPSEWQESTEGGGQEEISNTRERVSKLWDAIST